MFSFSCCGFVVLLWVESGETSEASLNGKLVCGWTNLKPKGGFYFSGLLPASLNFISIWTCGGNAILNPGI